MVSSRKRSAPSSVKQANSSAKKKARASTPLNHQKQTAPRLCSIYTQDVLQFLPRIEVEGLRQVSSALDGIVVGTGSRKLPKRVFFQLILYSVS